MPTPALSQIAGVESDLRALSLESRKKYVEVKQASEKAILKLRPSQETKIESECLEVLRSNVIIQPFLMACATKHPPLVIMSLNSMQRLSSCGALSAGSVAMLIGTLRILSESTQPDILLRILQTLSLLANPATFEAGEETIPQALGICFRLHVSELPIIYNTAAATLQQVISLVFERAIKNQQSLNSESNSTSLGVTQITALRLFIDLVLLASGDPPQWLTSIHSEIPRTVLFESINAIVKNYPAFLQSHQYFIDVIRNQLRPFVMRLLNTPNEFKICVRLTQIVANIIIYYHNCLIPECEAFMSLLIRMLEPEFQLWQRVLVLEAFKLFTEIPSLLVSFHTNFDCGQRNTKIFASMAHALGRSANQITLEDDKVSMSVTLWQLHKEKSKGLDLLSENVTPDYDELYSVSLATNSLINIVNAIGMLSEKGGLDDSIRATLSLMIMSTWYPILAAFMMLLEHAHQDEQVQHYLLSFQSFCFTCAKLDREAALLEFVKSLCVLSLPPGFRNLNDRAFDLNINNDQLQSSVSSKNLQSMKCLFNICHTCAPKLGNSWIVIFTTWEKLDLILSPNSKSSIPQASSEFEVLTKALNGFLESTSTFDKEILMQVLTSWGSLSLSSLANSATTENSNSDPLRLFPMVYFVKTLLANTYRIGFLWDFAVDHLSAVLHSKHAPIRAYGVQSIIRLVKTALKQLLDPNSPDSSGTLQKEYGISPAMYLKTFRPAMKGRFVENGNAIMVSLYDILQTSGAHLGDGWPVVISLLDDVISLDVAEHVPFAFKVVQVIVDDFLEALDFSVYPNLVHTIGRYGKQRLVANISFTSIGLLWQVSDHLIRVRSGEKQQVSKDCTTDDISSDNLQLILFSELEELSLDSRAELRNSAAQILHSTVAACGSYLSLSSWERCLIEILFKLYALLFRSDPTKEALPSEVESGASLGVEDVSGSKLMMISHYSRDTAEKQWDETRVHALQGSARIFRQYFRFHEGEHGQATWIAYLKFIEDAICVYSSEVAHYAIESVRDILQSSQSISALQKHRELTDQILILFKNVVNKAMEVKQDVPFDVYTELLDCVSGLIGESGCHIFSAQDLLLFLQLADYLSSLVPTQAREPSTQGRRETSLQRATLLLIDRLIVVESPSHLYAAVLLQIIKYVAGAVLTETSSTLDLEAAHAFARRSMPVLSTLFCMRCPVEVQGRVDIVVPMLDSLRAIMTSDSMAIEMIRVAVAAFNEIVPCAVIAVKTQNDDKDLIEPFWSKLQESFSGFLSEMPSRSKALGIQVDDSGLVLGNDHLIGFEVMQVEMVQLFSEKVFSQLDGSFPNLEKAMLSVLMRDHQSTTVMGLKSWSSAHEPAGKIMLMETGLNSLFDCVSRFPYGLGIQAVEILRQGCIQILHDFVEDDCRSGTRPLPEFRSRQVRLILKRLDLRLVNSEASGSAETQKGPNGFGRKRLLLEIFPHLCHLTTIRDTQVQRALSHALLSVSEEIRLGNTTLMQNPV